MSDEYNSLISELERNTNRYTETLNTSEILRIRIAEIEGRIADYVYKD